MQKKVIRAKRKEDAIKLAQNTLGNDIVILVSKLVQSEKNPNEKSEASFWRTGASSWTNFGGLGGLGALSGS